MKIIDILQQNLSKAKPTFSIEIIPPRNGSLISSIFKKIGILKEIEPDFISITRGAGGSLRGGTVPIAYFIKQRFQIETMAHLTCIDTSVEELENLLMDHHYLNIENILALRGDPPRDAPLEYKEFRGLNYHKYAKDLVQQIQNMNKGQYLLRETDKKSGDSTPHKDFRSGEPTSFCVAVAGHPGGHPDCPDPETVLDHLKEKTDKGGDFIITQMIFSVEIYLKFVEGARKRNISIPIIPGVRPITEFQQIERIESFFKVPVAPAFKEKLQHLDKTSSRPIGIELTEKLCRDLLQAGAPGIHLYIMNDAITGRDIIKKLKDNE